jgi:hypothetical protein
MSIANIYGIGVGHLVRAASIGLLAGLTTFLVLGPSAAYGSQIWAVFLAWASFLLLGGGLDGLRKTIVHNLFGVIVGLAALAFATQQPSVAEISYAAWAAIGVALTVGVIVLASKLSALSNIPASLLGYVAVLVAALPDYRLDKILAPNLENPVIGVVASLIAGALLAYVAEAIADYLRARLPQDRAGEPA